MLPLSQRTVQLENYCRNRLIVGAGSPRPDPTTIPKSQLFNHFTNQRGKQERNAE
jgi:hypothetical protein